jgi:predicted phosphodiesterase
MRKYLIIGDSHAKPAVSNRRYHWLGKLARDLKPDVVVNMGDWFDMESLCSYDRGTKGFEGRRYKNDIDCGNNALEIFDHYTKKMSFEREALEGNHEHRASRAIETEPQLEGVVGLESMAFNDFGWNLTKYEGSSPGVLTKDRIAFSHFHVTGIMQRSISGEHPAYTMIMKRHMSCIAGHSHLFDYAERNNARGERLQGVIAGCYLDPRQFEGYAGSANWMWKRGLLILRDVRRGEFDHEWISTKRILREYG